MTQKLRTVPISRIKKGTRILMRVDWNVSLDLFGVEEFEKIDRTKTYIKELSDRGAVICLLTHLGRPKAREPEFSTKKLAEIVSKRWRYSIEYLNVNLSSAKGAKDFKDVLAHYSDGTVILAENVRFQPGEEENSSVLSKWYGQAGELFINDAFASCHRSHASVVGISRVMPSFAGPGLIGEVTALDRLLEKPKKPYYAFIGGAKLSTKIPVIEKMLRVADKVFIGGAMAHPFFVAKRKKIGASFIEKGAVTIARRLMKNPKIILPEDVLVAKDLKKGAFVRSVTLDEIHADDRIGDIGMNTVRHWSQEIRDAKTIVWNGPFGVTEISTFSHSSLMIAKSIALQSKRSCFTVAGGGDTLPVIAESGMGDLISFVSTGGGAMLEYITLNGKLPGIIALKK